MKKATIVIDNGRAGLRLIETLTRHHGPPTKVEGTEDSFYWENPDEELLARLVDEYISDELILDVHLETLGE